MKKAIAILLALVSILSFAACGNNADTETTTQAPETTKAPEATADPSAQLDGDLIEIGTKIIENTSTIEFALYEPKEIVLSDIEAAKSFIGVDPTDKVEKAVFVDPQIGVQPFSLCLVKPAEGVDVEALTNEILEGVNYRKWMCVAAEKVLVSNCGDTILMVMASEEIVDDVYNAFNIVASGNASPALTKAGEVQEEPPVDGGEADMNAPAAMPGEDEGIILG